jgi:hypothetical protein
VPLSQSYTVGAGHVAGAVRQLGSNAVGGKPPAPRSPSSPHLGAMDHAPSSSRRTPERVPAPLFAPPRHGSPSRSWTASPPVSSGCPAAQRARPVSGIPCQASITVQRSNGRPFRPDRRVFTFTTVRRPFLPAAGKADVPFTTVLVELDGPPGLRLVGRLVDGVDPTIGHRQVHQRPRRRRRRVKPSDGSPRTSHASPSR